jgi:hypothetical protein
MKPETEPKTATPKKRRKPSKPWNTVALPYLDEINEMRSRTPPLSYRAISRELKRLHDFEIAHNTIMKAVNARKKPRKVTKIDPSFLSHITSKGSTAKSKTTFTDQKSDGAWDRRLEINGPLTK